MNTVGIIAEYNPFHRGHAYHIEKTRQITGADYVVVAMSGDYVQRGEPACTDKYFRARMALLGGADLVVELPVAYASASAEFFAAAGVKLLSALSCVDYLSFGSEWGDLGDYEPFVDLLAREGEDYRNLLQYFLTQGDSFPLARSRALETLMQEGAAGKRKDPAWTESFLKEPNHILGLEYLKAIRRQGSGLVPVIVKREGAAYHDRDLSQGLSSAAAIRDQLALFLSSCDQERSAIGEKLHWVMGDQADSFLDHVARGNYVTWDDLMPLLDYRLLMTGQGRNRRESNRRESNRPEANRREANRPEAGGRDRRICDLRARIYRQYPFGVSFEELIDTLHTKNRTDTALKRELLHILLGIEEPDSLSVAAESSENFDRFPKQRSLISLPYARVLGFRRTAGPLLKRIRRESGITLIQRSVEGLSLSSEMYAEDLRAADLYEQVVARRCGRRAVSELKRQQMIID